MLLELAEFLSNNYFEFFVRPSIDVHISGADCWEIIVVF